MNASQRIAFQRNPEHHYLFLVAVDGELDSDSSATKIGERRWNVRVRSEAAAQALCSMPLEELETIFESLTVPIRPVPHAYLTHANLLFADPAKATVNRVAYLLNLPVTRWANPWTIEDLYEELEKVVEESGVYGLRVLNPEPILADLARTISCEFAEGSPTAADQLATWNPTVTKSVELAVSRASKRMSRDAVVAFFEFPPEVSTACQQYLVYFVQFLRDLGIDATADVHEEAQRVLFTVTPKTGREALEQVQEALAIFLSLPARQDLQTAPSDDVAVDQLRANVLHLQSQMALAAAVMRAKDAQIEALELSTYQYKQLLALPPIDDARGGAKDSVDLLGGIVRVVRYKGKGFELDLPALWRKLRRR